MQIATSYHPDSGETICPPPMDFLETMICVSQWIQKVRRIYVHPTTGPQSAHFWWPASSQRAHILGSCAMGQMDGSRYSKMPPRAGAQ